MKRTLILVILVWSSLLPQVVGAHPGHGHENPLSPGHYIANPQHVIPLALAVAAALAFVVVHYYFKKEEKRTK